MFSRESFETPFSLNFVGLIKSLFHQILFFFFQRQYEVPEYLALLNPGETPGKTYPVPLSINRPTPQVHPQRIWKNHLSMLTMQI